MAAARKLPSSDEVGINMLEQLLRHGGKKRMKELDTPPAEVESPEEESKSGEVDLDALEQLLGEKKECESCGGKGCADCAEEE